jgi:hypothetical protein
MIEIGQKNLKFNDEKEILKIKAVKEYCKKRKIEFQILTEDYFKENI